jgi:hypothetical protein
VGGTVKDTKNAKATHSVSTPSLDYLLNQFADRVEAHPPKDWSLALLSAFNALMDLHFAEGGTNRAPVLQLVPRGE